MADEKKLTEEEQKVLDRLEDQRTKLGEIFSQCWESEEFKKAFIAEPKVIFKEYGVDYNEEIEYKIIDTPPKTVVNVLPYKGVKGAVKAYAEKLNKMVEDIADDEEKQILLEDWSWVTYQNTEKKTYIPIPISPDSLTPEELEMINGGCLAIGAFFVVAGAIFFVGVVQSVATVTTAVTFLEAITAQIGATNAFVLNWSLAVGGEAGADIGGKAIDFGDTWNNKFNHQNM